MLVSLYVHEFFAFGSALQELLKIKLELSDRFERQSCDETKLRSGLVICLRNAKKPVPICQASFALNSLIRFNTQNSKPDSTLNGCNIIAEELKNDEFISSTLYRQAIIALLYEMICTRLILLFL